MGSLTEKEKVNYVSAYDGKVRRAGDWARANPKTNPWDQLLEEEDYVNAINRAKKLQQIAFKAKKLGR